MTKLQCKDIDGAALLRFINRKSREKGGGWVLVGDLEPPYSDLPDNLFRAKTSKLIKQGLLDGCPCGCRGDYELTDKGLELIGEARPERTPFDYEEFRAGMAALSAKMRASRLVGAAA